MCQVAPRRNLKSVDTDDINTQILNADWSDIFLTDCTAEKWQVFQRIFLSILDAVAPVRRVRTRPVGAPPITADTRALLDRRQRSLQCRSPDYKEINRHCRAAIRRDCEAHFQRELADARPHDMWRVLRPLIGSKTQSANLPDITADALNQYYVSVGPTTAAAVPAPTSPVPIRLPRVCSTRFEVQPIDIDTLSSVVLGMKGSTSTGTDGVSVRMIQKFFTGLAYPLLNVVNTCLITCGIPPSWKHALVTPVPKGKDSSEAKNTRPISILPAAMKIVERVVQRQLVDYLDTCHLLSDTHHGYRSRHSTETALHVVTDRVLSAMDRGEVSILVLLDLSKCFDVVPHETLLQKLTLYGIDNRWFRSYLTGHTQQVQLRNRTDGSRVLSQTRPNNIGVFQGGSLSCVLYMLYANELSLYVPDRVTVVQFADDTQLLVSGKKSDAPMLVSTMENALSSIYQWFCANGMKVNAAKTQMVVFGTPAMLRNMPPVVIRFCDSAIPDSHVVRNLGITMDRHLNYQSHIDSITKKCIGTLIALNHARHVIPKSALKTIVQCLVMSIVRYCVSLYGTCGELQMRRVQKILNFCARVVTGRKRYDHVSDVFHSLHWMRASEMAYYHRLCIVHNVITTGLPTVLAETIGETGDLRHTHATRNSAWLGLPQIRTENGRKRLNYSAVLAYNQLPFTPSRSFRRQLKSHILTRDAST